MNPFHESKTFKYLDEEFLDSIDIF